MKKIKISELPESRNLSGLYTIGTDENNRSVKVPLDFLDGVAEAANQANETASQAKTQAENAVSLLNSAIVQSEGNDTQKVMSQSAVTQSLQEVRLAANSISDDVGALQTEVGRKADRSDTYTKTEADAAIDSRINGIINGAPEALDTLKEIADAIGEEGSAINTLRGSVVENAGKILSLERTNITQQRAIDRLSGNLETYVSDFQAQCDTLSDNVGYLTETKADKRGIYDNMTVGNAKQLLPDSGEVVEGHYTKRTTARSASVMSGAAQIASLKGLTVKQLIKNGNFSEGLDGWTRTDGVVNSSDYITANYSLGWNNGLSMPVNLLSGHKVYFSARIKGSGQLRIKENDGLYATPNWAIVSFVRTIGTASNLIGTWPASSSNPVEYTLFIDKSYGVRLIDLTELGLDTVLTTAEQCDEFFGDKYIPYGISSFVPQMHKAVGFQQFDKNTMVINGKGIDEDGNLVDSATDSVAVIPCVKSETGTGKNNGYRVKGRTYRVGWNPFHPDNGCFDKVYGIAVGEADHTDYSANGKGYLYVSAAKYAIKDLIVHLKWSYSDDQFDEIYANSDRCRYKESNVDLSSLGELNGLYNNGWYSDAVNFLTGDKVIRCQKLVLTGNESWGIYDNLYYLGSAGIHADIKGSLCSHFVRVDGFQSINDDSDNVYGIMVGAIGILYKDTWNNGSINGTTNDFKNWLRQKYESGDPVTIWIAHAGYMSDSSINLPTIYNCDDFGTEEMVSNVPMGAISTEYYENLKDSLRLLSKQSNEGGGFVTHEELAAALAAFSENMENVEPLNTDEPDETI